MPNTYLEGGLFTLATVLVHDANCVGVVKCQHDDGTQRCAVDAREAVQVVRAAGVVDVELGTQGVRDSVVAHGRDCAAPSSNQDAKPRSNGHVGTRAHGDAASQRRVLDMNHVELAVWRKRTAESTVSHPSAAWNGRRHP